MSTFKLFHHFAIWSVFFLLISNITAGKMVDFFGIPAPISLLCFPFIYIISDLLTEVYGYAAARKVLWYTTIAAIVSALYFQLVVIFPPSSTFGHNEAYQTVLGTAPQIAAAGIFAVFVGEITNNYIVAKMKLYFKGRYLRLRLVLSTLAGQFVNTAAFFIFGLWGILPVDALVSSILFGTMLKTAVEIVMLPVTVCVINKVKKIEGIDHYDVKTDFTPFKI
jgi:uncharacterized integral membrane protein (TIGR00697 family)